jgi:hypothetical protein
MVGCHACGTKDMNCVCGSNSKWKNATKSCGECARAPWHQPRLECKRVMLDARELEMLVEIVKFNRCLQQSAWISEQHFL